MFPRAASVETLSTTIHSFWNVETPRASWKQTTLREARAIPGFSASDMLAANYGEITREPLEHERQFFFRKNTTPRNDNSLGIWRLLWYLSWLLFTSCHTVPWLHSTIKNMLLLLLSNFSKQLIFSKSSSRFPSCYNGFIPVARTRQLYWFGEQLDEDALCPAQIPQNILGNILVV